MSSTETNAFETAVQEIAHAQGLVMEADPMPRSREETIRQEAVRFTVTLTAHRGPSTAESAPQKPVRMHTPYQSGVGNAGAWAKWAKQLPSGKRRDIECRGLWGISLRDINGAYGFSSGRMTIHTVDVREKVEKAFRPTLHDVLHCLLLDSAMVEAHSDWIEWAEEMGTFGNNPTAETVREARKSWDTIHEHRTALRQMFTPKQLEELTSLAAEY